MIIIPRRTQYVDVDVEKNKQADMLRDLQKLSQSKQHEDPAIAFTFADRIGEW